MPHLRKFSRSLNSTLHFVSMKKYLVAYKSALWDCLLYKTSHTWSSEIEDAKQYATLKGARIACSAYLREHLNLDFIDLEEVSDMFNSYVVLDSETRSVL